MNGAADRLDRHVLAGCGATQFLHRVDGLAVTIGRGGELSLGFGQGTVRRRRMAVPHDSALTSREQVARQGVR